MFHMLEVSLPIITVLLDLVPSLISCNTVHSISLSLIQMLSLTPLISLYSYYLEFLYFWSPW